MSLDSSAAPGTGIPYTGPTTVSEGTLVVNGLLAGTSAVTVETNATLEGNGIIDGPTEVQSGGTLAAGTPTAIGTLTTSDTTLDAGSTTMLRINKALQTNDSVVAGMLTYGGTLTVTNLAGTLAAGNTFQLFDATNYTGNFSATNLPPLGRGLAWNWTPTNGTLAVVATVPVFTAFSSSANGFSLTFSSPARLTGANYTIYATTNLALPISNWTVITTGVFGGAPVIYQDHTATNYPARFYKLVSP